MGSKVLYWSNGEFCCDGKLDDWGYFTERWLINICDCGCCCKMKKGVRTYYSFIEGSCFTGICYENEELWIEGFNQFDIHNTKAYVDSEESEKWDDIPLHEVHNHYHKMVNKIFNDYNIHIEIFKNADEAEIDGQRIPLDSIKFLLDQEEIRFINANCGECDLTYGDCSEDCREVDFEKSKQ